MRKLFLVCAALATTATAQTVTMETTARLIDSGDGPMLAVPADATEPVKPRVAPLRVTVPSEQGSTLMTLVNPASTAR